MREFEQKIPDWRQQVESSIFYERDVLEGTQFKVYTRPGIDFVVKIPKDSAWMQGYWLTEELAPEYAIPFIRVENLRLNINRVKTNMPESVVQIKAEDLLDKIAQSFQTKNVTQLDMLVRAHIDADFGFFKKGLFVPDPTYNNYGIDKEGKVKRLDFGDTRISFADDEEYSGLARARAASHYSMFFLLSSLGKRYNITMENGQEFSDVYQQEHNLPDPPARIDSVNSLIINQSGSAWSPEVTMFLANVGHEEFTRLAPNRAPFDLNEAFLKNLPSSLKRSH